MANIFRNISINGYRKWTRAAIDCYKSGFDCDNCTLIQGLETIDKRTCAMKAVVHNLIKSNGTPGNEHF